MKNSCSTAGGSADSRKVDMHLHTTHSDGVRTPAQTVEAALACGLAAIAVTDHDEVSGVAEAADTGRRMEVEVLSGVEITVERDRGGIHILGYGIDRNHPGLLAVLGRLRQSRFDRAVRIVERLAKIGVALDFDELVESAGPGSIGRLHIARAIYLQGAARSAQEAFNRYIGRGKPAYVDRLRISIEEAIDVLHAAGGLVALAHPKLNGADKIIPDLVRLGFDGIEVYHTRHSPADVERYRNAADRYGLLKTGGSDCHGPSNGQPAIMGTVPVPYIYFDRLKRRLANM